MEITNPTYITIPKQHPDQKTASVAHRNEDAAAVGTDNVLQCLKHNSLINVTTARVLVSYSQPGHSNRLLSIHNNSHHNGQVCWLKVSSSSTDTALTVDWFSQTCTEDNYVSVHMFDVLPNAFHSWVSTRWTGCEYKEDPISTYMTSVNTIYVGLHLHQINLPYQVSFEVRADSERENLLSKTGGTALEIQHVTPYSGNTTFYCVCSKAVREFLNMLKYYHQLLIRTCNRHMASWRVTSL